MRLVAGRGGARLREVSASAAELKEGSRGSGQRKTPHAAATFGVLTGLVGSRPPESLEYP